jgi:hypothetical protein
LVLRGTRRRLRRRQSSIFAHRRATQAACGARAGVNDGPVAPMGPPERRAADYLRRHTRARNQGATMDFASATLRAATCVLALLVSSQFTPTTAQTAQQDQTMTATASAPSKSDACTASMGKAYALCMARGFFNIAGVNCDCNQRNAPGAPWECVATATCKK